MPVRKTAAEPTTIHVDEIQTETITITVLGTSPLICNRLSEKAKHELLLPRDGRKTAADKAAVLKHDPIEEFQSSPYTIPDDDAPTFIAHMSSAFKGAMMSAALDLPGAKKAVVGRLVMVEGQLVPIYGLPYVMSAPVRSADINRTPDVRTRAVLTEWTADLHITFAVPLLNQRSVINLLAAAGKICGVGDWRPERGKGSYGCFVPTDITHPKVQEIRAEGGRAAQILAMRNPVSYDRDTDEILEWFDLELARRGKKRPSDMAAD